MIANACGCPDVATAPMASSVSEKSSVANFPIASSNGPAKAGTTTTAANRNARTNARARSRKWISTGRPRQRKEKAATCRLLRVVRRGRGSGPLTAALVGLGVVVTALLADPVADQILGALELLRPCIAGDEARGLPHHVKL